MQLIPPPPPSSAAEERTTRPPHGPPLVVFDAGHGQPNWAQTGFDSREMHTNFVGLMETLCRLGCLCTPSGDQPLAKYLTRAKLLVLPPPAGCYSTRREAWMPLASCEPPVRWARLRRCHHQQRHPLLLLPTRAARHYSPLLGHAGSRGPARSQPAGLGRLSRQP